MRKSGIGSGKRKIGRIQDDLTALLIEGEGNINKVAQDLFDARLELRARVKKHESAAAGAQQLAAESSIFHRYLVDIIHMVVRDLLCQRAFENPRLMQQLAEIVQVFRFPGQHPAGIINEGSHLGEKRRVVLDGICLSLRKVGGDACGSRKKEHEAAAELSLARIVNGQGRDGERAIRADADLIQPTVRNGNLILNAPGFLENFAFQVDGLTRQVMPGDRLTFQSMHRLKQTHAERGRRTDAGARRQVALVADFNTVRHPVVQKRGTNGIVLDILETIRVFGNVPRNTVLVFRVERREVTARDVVVIADAGGENAPSMLLIPPGIIGASAKEGDAVRCFGDNHVTCCCQRSVFQRDRK